MMSKNNKNDSKFTGFQELSYSQVVLEKKGDNYFS